MDSYKTDSLARGVAKQQQKNFVEFHTKAMERMSLQIEKAVKGSRTKLYPRTLKAARTGLAYALVWKLQSKKISLFATMIPLGNRGYGVYVLTIENRGKKDPDIDDFYLPIRIAAHTVDRIIRRQDGISLDPQQVVNELKSLLAALINLHFHYLKEPPDFDRREFWARTPNGAACVAIDPSENGFSIVQRGETIETVGGAELTLVTWIAECQFKPGQKFVSVDKHFVDPA